MAEREGFSAAGPALLLTGVAPVVGSSQPFSRDAKIPASSRRRGAGVVDQAVSKTGKPKGLRGFNPPSPQSLRPFGRPLKPESRFVILGKHPWTTRSSSETSARYSAVSAVEDLSFTSRGGSPRSARPQRGRQGRTDHPDDHEHHGSRQRGDTDPRKPDDRKPRTGSAYLPEERGLYER